MKKNILLPAILIVIFFFSLVEVTFVFPQTGQNLISNSIKVLLMDTWQIAKLI
jgi:hypothetical protein